ncbi:MAG TPA: tRNA (adenosine(37)-N6)-threonylcarbamoyltransferase complex ATPase subunit type 1 TsaE [Ktedonobacterales bacterium]|nr:tRNA (adenosine(37)-N6)-threonylcarbamoyltransferase complex ATPase subunit type 1 TsaE [Ktedonobacterales bacterium]
MSGPRTRFEPAGARQNDSNETRTHSVSVEQTRDLGKALGALLEPGDVVLLEGNLGAGKTALTQGIGLGLGIHSVINSPTFTILKEYTGRLTLYHFDLYRIESPDEMYALGFEDYFSGDGVCVVEWAERGEPRQANAPAPWPANYLRVSMRSDAPEGRLIEVTSAGPRGERLQTAWTTAFGSVAEER